MRLSVANSSLLVYESGGERAQGSCSVLYACFCLESQTKPVTPFLAFAKRNTSGRMPCSCDGQYVHLSGTNRCHNVSIVRARTIRSHSLISKLPRSDMYAKKLEQRTGNVPQWSETHRTEINNGYLNSKDLKLCAYITISYIPTWKLGEFTLQPYQPFNRIAL